MVNKNKKDKISPDNIIKSYMTFFLETSAPPETVYQFVKDQEFSEKEFYDHFGTFESLESNIYKSFFTQTIDLLESNSDYNKFDSKDKLLTFYYTIFEIFKVNRSYILISDKHSKRPRVSGMKSHFLRFINSLNIEIVDFKQEKIEELKKRGIEEFSWKQFELIYDFWKKDESPGFEKTDQLIEKLIQASFDLINTTPIKSILDLGKFIFKENWKKKL